MLELLLLTLGVALEPGECPHKAIHCGAYAEIECGTGHYTGYRFRFFEDPIVHSAALFEGAVWYKKNTVIPLESMDSKAAERKGKCLYA